MFALRSVGAGRLFHSTPTACPAAVYLRVHILTLRGLSSKMFFKMKDTFSCDSRMLRKHTRNPTRGISYVLVADKEIDSLSSSQAWELLCPSVSRRKYCLLSASTQLGRPKDGRGSPWTGQAPCAGGYGSGGFIALGGGNGRCCEITTTCESFEEFRKLGPNHLPLTKGGVRERKGWEF